MALFLPSPLRVSLAHPSRTLWRVGVRDGVGRDFIIYGYGEHFLSDCSLFENEFLGGGAAGCGEGDEVGAGGQGGEVEAEAGGEGCQLVAHHLAACGVGAYCSSCAIVSSE